MAQITSDQQRFEAAVTSLSAKLEGFRDGLSPDEQVMLAAVLRQAGAGPDEATDDVAGHVLFIREMIGRLYARLYVDSLPIWGSLGQLEPSSIDPNAGFDGSPPYSPQ